VQTKLNLITEIAGTDRKCKFNNLVHLLNVKNLKECFRELKKGKATGIDGVTLQEYEQELDSNLENLVARMKQFSYRPQASRRAYISKANGKKRPLGIPAVEDKIVQKGIVRILQAVFENDSLDCSYGFRPNRNCHQALNVLDKMIMQKPVNHVIDADIKGFFDNVDHDWLMRCLEQRISDKNLLRLLKRFLKAGIIEEGKYISSEKGTPQGGIISPILANIYLHYVLDLWFEKIAKKKFGSYIGMVRYCDDFVICVQRKEVSGQLMVELADRLAKFGLELSTEKTRIVAFGRYAGENSRKQDEKPGSFTFLGFTHFCDKGRKGYFKVGRKTDSSRFSGKVKEMNTRIDSY
jgi:group II intron reverse transcriptase/maturase